MDLCFDYVLTIFCSIFACKSFSLFRLHLVNKKVILKKSEVKRKDFFFYFLFFKIFLITLERNPKRVRAVSRPNMPRESLPMNIDLLPGIDKN